MEKCGLFLNKRIQLFTNSEYELQQVFRYYDYNQVALLSIGIWSSHSCYSATERIHDLAARANSFIEKMRSKGCHIIHGGSYNNYSCKMGRWEDTQLRKNMKGLPMAKLDDKGASFPPLPLDDSDGGYEKSDKNMEYNRAMVTIHPSISVDYEKDCISDNAKEILNYLHAKNIKVLLAFGTHTNMCVLDKPYGVKWYIRYGFPVVLVRDLCDTMYNPKMAPFVSQAESNNVMSEWLEKYVCPTVDSREVLYLDKKVIMADIDDTITEGKGYETCQPKTHVIQELTRLYDEGHNIVYWTARGTVANRDWYEHTKKQLVGWNAKHTLLVMKKPFFDSFLEDKSINLDKFDGLKWLEEVESKVHKK
jgi:hypothetical protein